MTTVFFSSSGYLNCNQEKKNVYSRVHLNIRKKMNSKKICVADFLFRYLYTNTVHIFQQGYFLSGGYLNCDLEKKNVYSRVDLNRRKKMNRKKICVADFFNFFYTCIFSSKVFLFIFQIIKICSLY